LRSQSQFQTPPRMPKAMGSASISTRVPQDEHHQLILNGLGWSGLFRQRQKAPVRRRRFISKDQKIWPASTAPLSRLPLVSYKLLYNSYHTASSCAPRLRRPVRPRSRGRLRFGGMNDERFGSPRLLAPPPPSPPFSSGVVLWGSLAPLTTDPKTPAIHFF
jgi:hypothetical protein